MSSPDGYEDPRGQVRKDHPCYRLLRPNIFVQMLSLLFAILEPLSSNFNIQNDYSGVRRSLPSDSSRRLWDSALSEHGCLLKHRSEVLIQ